MKLETLKPETTKPVAQSIVELPKTKVYFLKQKI